MLTFLELRELESSIEESEVIRYYYLEDGIMLQERVLSETKSVLAAVSDNQRLEWMLFESIDEEWIHVTSYSALALSSVLKEPLIEFAMHTGYIPMSESVKNSSDRGFDFEFSDARLEFADWFSKPIHKGRTTYQTYNLYHLSAADTKIIDYIKNDESFNSSDERKVLLNRSALSIDHKYDLDTFDLAVYQEGCAKIVEDLARLIEKKYSLKLVVDGGNTNLYKGKSVLYLQEICLDLPQRKAIIERFVKREVDELVIASLVGLRQY